MSSRHPVMSAAPSLKAQGVWVRHKTTEAVGYIAYVSRPRGQKPIIHVVYPPTPYNKEVANFKVYSAGQGHAEDFVRLKRKRKENVWSTKRTRG